ncbi:MAG: hypothetical protein LBU89_08835 [Fibromonadaceae bacterium]|jgi:hypothetical protein|nr:hypothetical protein [Fibromonadaceae bacterium]
MTKKKIITCILVAIVTLLLLLSHTVYKFLKANNAEDDRLLYDEPYYFFWRFNSFGRVNYGGFDEVRSGSIPEKSCYLEILNELYGKKKCAYAGNVKKVTLYSIGTHIGDARRAFLYSNEGERDSSWQIEANIFFSEASDTIRIDSYYQDEAYERKIIIYNGNLLEKEVVYNINKKWHYGRDYYNDKEELIKIIDWDSSFIAAEVPIPINYQIVSYTKDLKRKEYKQTVHGYLGLHSIVRYPLVLVHPIEFMNHPMEFYTKKREQPKPYERLESYESQWIWSYDDTGRLIEKKYEGFIYDSNQVKEVIFSPQKFAYFYDTDSLARVDVFGERGSRIGVLKFKNSKMKKQWSYKSSEKKMREKSIYDDEKRLRQIVTNVNEYFVGKEYRAILFDTLSNVISDSLFDEVRFLFLRKPISANVKKKKYTSEGKLERIEHTIKQFDQKIPLIGFGFTASVGAEERFTYDIEYDSIGNPNRIIRKFFQNDSLNRHTEFKLSYEYR